MASYYRCQKSIYAFLTLLVLGFAVPASADTEFIIKPGSLGDYELKSPMHPYLTITKEASGIFSVRFGVTGGGGHAGHAIMHTTPHFYEVDPQSTSKNYGINGPSGITFKGVREGYDYNTGPPELLVMQDGNVWQLFAGFGGVVWDGVERYASISTTTLIEGTGMPDYSRPYKLAVWLYFPNTAHDSEGHRDLAATIEKFWVHLSGGDGEDSTGGPGGGDDGGGDDGGGGGPPNKDPGDNPNDDPPDEDEMEIPDPPGDEDPPGTGIQCIDELMEIFKSKFPAFDQELTGGNDFWKVEFTLDVAGVEQTFYWSSKPDTAWEVGEALDKLRKWVRAFGILLMILFALRQFVIVLRQW